MRGEAERDVGEHAGPVLDLDADVEGRAELAGVEALDGAPARVVLEEAGARRADDRDHVGDDGGGRLDAAGARALERDLADGVALEHDGVEGARDRGERMLPVDEGGLHADVEPAVDEGCGADEPDGHAHLARSLDLVRPEALDALVVDVGERDARAERDGGEDRHLRGRVRARDVVGRVGLGEPARLRLGERLVVGGAALHFGEDEVGRPVDDAEDAVDVRDDERLPQHLDHRDRGADARLEAELDAAGGRRLEELGSPLGDELLVGGDDRLAGPQQVEDVLPGRLDAAHDLGHERDRLVLDDRGEVGRQDLGIGLVRALLRRVADERLDHAQAVAGRALDVVGVFVKESVYRRPDGPVAQKGDGNVNGRHEPPGRGGPPGRRGRGAPVRPARPDAWRPCA